MKTLSRGFTSVLLLFICVVLRCETYSPTPPSSTRKPPDEWYVIRSTTSGLAVDASIPTQIQVQHFTGYSAQLWKFEQVTRPGVYYIISKSTGTVLDVNPNRGVFLNDRSNSSNQHWILNSNGHLYNLGKKESLYVSGEKFTAGNFMHVWPDNGEAGMAFYLQKDT